jgi:formylglycine-generating enzyme required for sulfatase activity
MKRSSPSAFLCAALVCGTAAHAAMIDTVLVGNAGNVPDTRYGGSFGAVGRAYRIGKFEVTAGQYTELLNAVAASDPFELYNPLMDYYAAPASSGANIHRTGSPGDYRYSVPAEWAKRPVNYVSFWDAARFANWLHNGQPMGTEGPGTTEDGAYVNVGNQATFARQPGARFWIPSEDEWYKAAYHDRSAGLAAVYFDFPTGTNSTPGIDITEATNPGNNANFHPNNYAIGSPYYRTEAGEFDLSESAYGTFDQAGNVWEWNDILGTGERGLRGGSFSSGGSSLLHASLRLSRIPTGEFSDWGFRMATIPEPSSLALCFAVVRVLLMERRQGFLCTSRR